MFCQRCAQFVFFGFFLSPLEGMAEVTLIGLHKKLKVLEERVGYLESGRLVKTQVSAHVQEETKAYNYALTLLKAALYSEARADFRRFCVTYPKSQSFSSALYWIGVTFFAEALYGDSSEVFLSYLKKWPQGDKVMDAHLKLILCYQRLGDLDKARISLMDFRKTLEIFPPQDPSSCNDWRDRANALERTLQDNVETAP